MRQKFHQWWAQRNQREKYVLLGGGLAVFLFLTMEWFVLPTLDRLNQLDLLIVEKEREIGRFEELRHRYHGTHSRLENIVAKLEKQERGFSLVAYIEQMTMAQQVKHAVVELRPIVSSPIEGYQETAVELALENISLRQAVSLLEALESSPYYLQVKRFSMKSRFSDPSVLDVRLVVSTYAPSSLSNNLQG
jgi:general secretion pathway protein M